MRTWLRELDEVLRGAKNDPERLAQGTAHIRVAPLFCASLILGAFYGVCMGFYALLAHEPGTWLQMLVSAVKVPALFYLTLAFTYPALYVFGSLMGVKLSAADSLRMLVAMVAVSVTVLASLGLITAFFTLGSYSYAFMTLVNVLCFAIAGFAGVVFLWRLLLSMQRAQAPPAEAPARRAPADMPEVSGEQTGPEDASATCEHLRVRRLFRMWLMLYAVVGMQMAWILRPFIASPDAPWSVFRPRESNVFAAILRTLRVFLGG